MISREKNGRSGRGGLLMGLLICGIVFLLLVYLHLWSTDARRPLYDNREDLRRQFERANLEAMDESAEWRMKYDVEVDRGRQMQNEIHKVTTSLASATRRFDMLQKENTLLRKELTDLRQRCDCNSSAYRAEPI